MSRGNCYVTSEALFHLLGGKRAGWKPMRVKWAGDMHWFLKHENGLIVDPTVAQFAGWTPPYEKAIGCGFLTKRPSKRAVALMTRMVWQ